MRADKQTRFRLRFARRYPICLLNRTVPVVGAQSAAGRKVWFSEKPGMSRAQIWTLPNAISAYRIVAGPTCMWLLTTDGPYWAWAALAIMISAEISDLIDGRMARASAQVTNFGKILDPMADSLYRGAVFIAFVINGWMPIWMLSIIIWRDLTVSYLREIAELEATTLSARTSGKWKAIAQGVAQIVVVGLVAFFGPAAYSAYEPVIQILLLIAVAVTAYSLFDYTSVVLQKKARRA